MKLKHKILSHPGNGKKYYILNGKPVGDGNRNVYLLSNIEIKRDYSLWYFQYEGDGNFAIWPYEGDDSSDLIKELLENFVETSFEDD